jgi:hypothetical protein
VVIIHHNSCKYLGLKMNDGGKHDTIIQKSKCGTVCSYECDILWDRRIEGNSINVKDEIAVVLYSYGVCCY